MIEKSTTDSGNAWLVGATERSKFAERGRAVLVEGGRQLSLAGEVAKALDTLTARELQVLRMRFGLGDRVRGMDEVVHHCGLTWDRAWRIERRALRKLRASAVGAHGGDSVCH